MANEAEVFWLTLGTMGITANIRRSPTGQPAIDFTTVNAAKFRAVNKAGVESFWVASILGTPTPTLITVRHLFVAGDYVPGPYLIFGEVSNDGGSTWFPTGPATMPAKDSRPS